MSLLLILGLTQRSGTNHLARVLGLHPDVAVCPGGFWEFPFLRQAEPLVAFAESFCRHPKVRETSVPTLLSGFGSAMLTPLEREAGSRRVLLKEPSVAGVNRVFDFFPDARVVIIGRDGRDYACSALRTRFAAPPKARLSAPRSWRWLFRPPLAELARRWTDAAMLAEDFLATTRAQQRPVARVRYEDLVREPHRTLAPLLEFAGLDGQRMPWDRVDRVEVVGSSFVGNREGDLDWQPKQIRASELDSIGRHRQWSARERRIFERIAGRMLACWGYL